MSDEKMHIDKSVSVGHLVSICLLLCALVGGWLALHNRVVANEIRIQEISARQDRLDLRLANELADINRKLSRIEDRLDDKADR